MFDHVGIPVSDYEKAKSFYAAIFKPLGFSLILEVSSEETGGQSQQASVRAGSRNSGLALGRP